MADSIYLVDDDVGFRRSLVAILDSVGFSCSEWDTPQDFIEIDQFDRPGCIVLDYRLPTLSGLEVLKKVRERSSIPVVLISAYADVRLAVSALQGGAAGVFEKPLDDNEFLGFVERLCFADRDHVAKLQVCRETQKTISGLSEPERQVLDLMLQGLPNKAIARDLDKSVKAVERNRQNLLAKFAAKTTQEALLRVSRCPMDKVSPLTCNSLGCLRSL
ncbi:MAG: response regulator transcription factor [Sphingomonadales bacterium]|nr:response regulator transcription factor [Sphingomonadales bacterium]